MNEAINAEFNGSIKRGYLAPNIDYKRKMSALLLEFSVNSEMKNDCDFQLSDTIIVVHLTDLHNCR